MKYKLDIKAFLKQANWNHPDFGKVANFFGELAWFVDEKDITPVEEKVKGE